VLKPKEQDYKVTDRDGMYVHVTAKGAMSFRMDYRLNGRRETIYLGKYGPNGLSLARACEKRIDARRNIAARYSHCHNTTVLKTNAFLSFLNEIMRSAMEHHSERFDE
jgi:hypothetical protein